MNEAPWITLFNGKDLSGWTPKIKGFAAGENFADTFRVQDGAIVVGYEGYDKFDGRFGHLFFEHEYTNYTLELEYRFTGTQLPDAPGWAFRNSGIMIHGQSPQSMRVDQDFPVSVEVQLLGGDGIQDRHTANVCSPGTDLSLDGKKARAHCNDSRSKTYHGDEWVKVRVVVRGHELVRHEIDGEVVLEYGNLRLDARDADAKAIIEAHDGETQLGRGTLSLQSESHPCAFRNIRLRVDE
ncbi:MAG: DUF1080 domain-containing protein [Planctomycetes bacterium]|nr:DUF1080 domain-containing protein [Planctomycetota bacterium]